MKEIRHSKQREAIMEYLRSTTSHPTAETIYSEMRSRLPNISLGTVYRNLTLLEEMGEIRRIPQKGDADRFDSKVTPHGHFKCNVCGSLSDIFIDESSLDGLAAASCGCKITGHDLIFFGICSECSAKID